MPRIVWWSAAIWLATRVINAALTIATVHGTALTMIEHWHFWDSGYYYLIAHYGYYASDPRLAVYFPLYAMLE